MSRSPRASVVLVGIVSLGLLFVQPAFAQSKGGSVHVRGYTRKDGTYVAPHERSAPDSTPANNWSTKGNVNPYTGAPGTKPISSSSPPQAAPAQAAHALPSSMPAASNPWSDTTVSGTPASPAQATSGGSAPAPRNAASLERPSELTRRQGWQIRHADPRVPLPEQFRLTGADAVACGRYYYSPCRPVTDLFPALPDESVTDRAVFFGATNLVTDTLEVWGYPNIGDCGSGRDFVAKILASDYAAPSACTVVALKAAPRPTAVWPVNQPIEATQVGLQKAPVAAADDDAIAAALLARQDKYVRVCRVIQKLGKGIDGLTKDEAAQVVAQSIPDFSADDFTQISVKFRVVDCFEPHTRTVDHCTSGEILRYRKGGRCP
jgi:hypothetical protein